MNCPQCGASSERRCVGEPFAPCLLTTVREARLVLVPASAVWDREPAGPREADRDDYWKGWRDATDAIREAASGSTDAPKPPQ